MYTQSCAAPNMSADKSTHNSNEYKRTLSYISVSKRDLHTYSIVYTLVLSFTLIVSKIGGARGVMIIVIGNGHGDTSSNPGRD